MRAGDVRWALRDIDGTANFADIGANVAVALSLANAKAAASAMGMPLFRYLGGAFVNEMPLPLGNIIGGGAHALNSTDIQEFLVVPGDAADVEEAVFANAAVHRQVKELVKETRYRCRARVMRVRGHHRLMMPSHLSSLPKRPDLSLTR